MAKNAKTKQIRPIAPPRPILAPHPWWLDDRWRALMIFALVLVVYAPAMHAGFIWDDDVFLYRNALITLPGGFAKIWFGQSTDYLPLTLSSLWLEWRLFGPNPAGYHIINILLHAANAILLWQVLRRMRVPGAFLAGLLIAVHPVNVASVAWITERKNTLSMFFALLSVLAFLRYEEKPGWRRYALSLLLFAAALFSKSSTVVLAPILLLYRWWRSERLTRRDVLITAPWFVLAFVMGLIAIKFQDVNTIGAVNVRPEGWPSRIAATGWIVWFYLYKAFLPLTLLMPYPRWNVDPANGLAWLPLLALLLTIAFLAWRRMRHPLFAFGCLLLALGPVLGLLKMSYHRYSLVADHLQHLALLAPVALTAAFLTRAEDRMGKQPMRIVSGILIAALGFLTFVQCTHYKDAMTLWTYNIAKNPQCWVGYDGIAVMLSDSGDKLRALEYHNRACEINPNDAALLSNRGSTLLDLNRRDAALRDFENAIHANPANPDPWFNRGSLRLNKGMQAEALADFTQTLKIEPTYVPALANRAAIYFTQQKFDQALKDCNRAIELAPGYAKSYSVRANVFMVRNRIDEALKDYSQAIQLNPNDSTCYHNRAVLLGNLKRHDEALADLDQAIRLNPNYGSAYLLRGMERANRGDFDGAEQDGAMAAKLKTPMPPDFHQRIQQARQTSKGQPAR